MSGLCVSLLVYMLVACLFRGCICMSALLGFCVYMLSCVCLSVWLGVLVCVGVSVCWFASGCLLAGLCVGVCLFVCVGLCVCLIDCV